MPVYQRFASNEILLRCVSGKTQNANESLHSCILRKCPKDVFVSKKRINLAVTAAVSEVNIGYVETLKLNNNEMVDAAFKIAHRRDNRRLTPSVSTIEPPIIPNILTFKSVGFPLLSAIFRVSVVTSCLSPIFLPIPVWESIARALDCISEFLTGTPDPSI
ncbi:uncharacterized protein TNCV_2420101 [Trichonephila clavipes]|nr:uncharacterized protein TNCV_2420101 [Trichonephila clavipes]